MCELTESKKVKLVEALEELLICAKIYRQDPADEVMPSFQNGFSFCADEGICINMYYTLVYHEDLAQDFDEGVPGYWIEIYQKWPDFSGNNAYPIPHPEGRQIKTPLDTYHGTVDKWTDHYGDLRMNLLKFLINQLKGE